jgi:putative holliday junction resolvase
VQQKETTNPPDLTDVSRVPTKGRLVAIDPGTKRVGVSICDETRVAITRLPIIKRSSWKILLSKIRDILEEYDAVGLVVGLPYNFDGTESEMSSEARRMATNFAVSLERPVFLQDERASTYEARGRLWAEGLGGDELSKRLDSEAAAIILADFIDRIPKA